MHSQRSVVQGKVSLDSSSALADRIKAWGRQLGFQQIGITDTDLATAETRLLDWLDAGHHAGMGYMERHGTLRSRPADLLPGTLRVISARMDYRPESQRRMQERLADPAGAFISRYTLGRDYHKVLRQRLRRLAALILAEIGPFGYRLFVDSAPVMEKPLAEKAGLGWIGKHTNLIHPQAGSWFFLGEIYTDLSLPIDPPQENHCGRCHSCLDACPTRAIIAPYRLDARRCISYLTVEHQGSIPCELRIDMGNRIFGCDDCQLACPWNRFSQTTAESDFLPRQGLDAAALIALFGWDEAEFLQRTEGSAIRRIRHHQWLRNIAVALGNGSPGADVLRALSGRSDHPDPIVREHVAWALERQTQGARTAANRPSPEIT